MPCGPMQRPLPFLRSFCGWACHLRRFLLYLDLGLDWASQASSLLTRPIFSTKEKIFIHFQRKIESSLRSQQASGTQYYEETIALINHHVRTYVRTYCMYKHASPSYHKGGAVSLLIFCYMRLHGIYAPQYVHCTHHTYEFTHS